MKPRTVGICVGRGTDLYLAHLGVPRAWAITTSKGEMVERLLATSASTTRAVFRAYCKQVNGSKNKKLPPGALRWTGNGRGIF